MVHRRGDYFQTPCTLIETMLIYPQHEPRDLTCNTWLTRSRWARVLFREPHPRLPRKEESKTDGAAAMIIVGFLDACVAS